METDLRGLMKQERDLRQSVVSMRQFIQDFEAAIHSRQLDARLQRLEDVFRDFQVVRRKIELLTEDVQDATGAVSKKLSHEQNARLAQAKDAENARIISELEAQYFDLKVALQDLKPKKEIFGESAAALQPGPSTSHSRVKLPDIRLPSFSGQIMEWITFRDKFKSLIHDNRQLSTIDKFCYLQSSLTGEALQEIQSVEMTAANYDVAWSALEKRFENKKLIVQAHLDSLFAVDAMQKESYDSLNRLVSAFETHLQMLAKVGEETDGWSTILVHMICSRLAQRRDETGRPSTTRRR